MFPPDLQAEFLDLEMLQQIDICPEQAEVPMAIGMSQKEETEEDLEMPLPF